MDSGGDDGENHAQLLSKTSAHGSTATLVEETPLIDAEPIGQDDAPPPEPEIRAWDTSMLSEACREGDIASLRAFVEYSIQTLSCGKHAAEMADRIDPETGLSPLHLAARYQQLDVCLILLSNIDFVFGVNIKDANGRTPIHDAFRSSVKMNVDKTNPEECFQIDTDFGIKIQELEAWQEEYRNTLFTHEHPLIYLFAKAKGNINAQDKYLLTPLHYAVTRDNLPGVKQLVSLNAYIESRDRQGIRPLHLACKEGYLSIVEFLIDQGAKIDATDSDGWTPMHYVCAKGHLDVIKLIKLREGLQFQRLIQMKTNTSASCLHLAVQHGNRQSVEYILKDFHGDALKTFINEQAEPFGTPLHFAAKFCDPSMVKLLHQNDADPLRLNSQNQSALHIASAFNRLPIVQELFALTQATLLNIQDARGQTALSVTTSPEIVDELLAAGADITSIDDNRMNALMIAVSKSQSVIVERLLFPKDQSVGTMFEQVDKRYHRSILLLAAQTGSVSICSLLLMHPAIRWDTIDKQRMNALHLAARYNHHELIEFLSDHIRKSDRWSLMKTRSYSGGTSTTDSEPASSSSSGMSILRSYIDAQNDDGKTPLHLAAERGHNLCIQALLKCGADVLLTNSLGQLALHTAIQNGHVQCVDLLIKACTRNMADFQSALSRRQSPLITACHHGFTDIVDLLLSQEIGTDCGMGDNGKPNSHVEENPLEVAIKYHRTDTLHALLEHPHTEHWLAAVGKTDQSIRQTPLRDMIRYMPECAKHAFDKLIVKTSETDQSGELVERIVYRYHCIDDYFQDNGQLYTSHPPQLYRNHPFIIALDAEHHSLLQHPLARRLMERKWKSYRPLFYLTRILTALLLLALTVYVLIVPAPHSKSFTAPNTQTMHEALALMRWIIVALAAMNFLKILLEILLYRGFRVVFAQIFSLLSFLTSIIAFLPLEKTNLTVDWQWQLAALSTSAQWFNIAFIMRSVPFVGNVIVMVQSVLANFGLLTFVALPLLVAFTISTQMIFYNHPPFVLVGLSIHKLSAMLIGEYDYETLFHAKPALLIAGFIFTPFMVIMTILFMNLLLGLTIGDLHSCMEDARAKAHSYRIRELLYIEASLPSVAWLRSNIVDDEVIGTNTKESTLGRADQPDEDELEEDDPNGSLLNQQQRSELRRLLDIVTMLCTQAQQVLEKEIGLEKVLRQLIEARKTSASVGSSSDRLNTSGSSKRLISQ